MNNGLFAYSIDTAKNGRPGAVTLSHTPKSRKQKPLSIKIAPELGSNMYAMRYGEHDILYHEPRLLRHCGFTGAFNLFPTPNRVENGRYSWRGRRIVQTKRGKIVLLHGLVFDEPWKCKPPEIHAGCVRVRTEIRITRKSDLYDAYPFPCTLALEYFLYPSRVRIAYTVKNQGNVPMPFGFGVHPYFALLSGGSKTHITIPAKSWMESPKDTLLPTGRLISVAGKPYDARRPTPVEKLKLDHVYADLNGFAVVNYRTLGFEVILKPSTDFTHLVVCTSHKKAVCIENQTCSTDAHNLWARGFRKESHLLTVKPRASHAGFIEYEIRPNH